MPSNDRVVLANVIWEETLNEKKSHVARRAAVCVAQYKVGEGWRAVKSPLRIDDEDDSPMPSDGLYIDAWREVPRPAVAHYEETSLYTKISV